MEKQELVITLKSLFEDEGFKTLTESLQDLDKKVKEFDKEAAKLKKTSLTFKDIGDAAKKMQLTVTTPLIAAGTAAVMGASKIESFTATFKTMLGNEEAAEKLISQLNRMAAVTPFDPEPLIQSTKTLLAYQIEVEDVEKTLKMLGDASSGSAETLNSLATAYGKVATKGRASMEELNIMIDRGVPILEYLGQTLNATGEEIINMTSQGKISFSDVNAAFEKMTSEGGVFYEGMATASETLEGKISTLTGGISQFASMMAESLVPVAKKAVDSLISITDGLMNMDESSKAAVLTTAAVAAALPPVITSISVMTKKIKEMTVAMRAGNMAALANPYTAIGVAITAIVAGLVAWIRKQNDLDAKVKDLAKMSEKTAAAIEKVTKAREAEKEAIEKGEDAESKKNEVIQAEIEFQEKLEKQLKKTASASHKPRVEIKETEELLEKYKKRKELLEKLQADGVEKVSDPLRGVHVQRIPILEALETANTTISGLEEKLANLEKTKNSILKEIVEDTATALRGNIDVEDVLLKKGSETYLVGKDILEQAIEYNRILKERQEIEEKDKDSETEQTETTTSTKDDKDRYDKLEEIYKKYNNNKMKIESDLLTNIEKKTLQAENNKNQAAYDEYCEYLKRKEAAAEESQQRLNETQSLHAAQEYLDKMEDMTWGYYEDYQEYLDLQAESDKQYYAAALDEYFQYLESRKAAGIELSEAEQSLLNRKSLLDGYEQAEKMQDKQIDKAKILGDWLYTAANSFVTEFETGNVEAELLGSTVSRVAQMGVDLVDTVKNADTGVEAALAGVAAGFSAVGDIVANIFSAATESINDEIEAMIAEVEGNLEKELKLIDEAYEARVEAADKAKEANLNALKEEYAARGIIIETGLETELEKAQAAYDEALKALEEYENESTSTRQAQLDAYKEQLAARNDEDIQQAMEAKQRELDAIESNKKAELQKNADTAKAEAERQKILEDAEKAAKEMESQYQYEKDLAEYNSEVDKLTRQHELEVEQFNLQKAQDIAAIWIAQASGIATIWATAMQLGPIAGPIAAAALTGTMATVAGVQTGLIASQSPPAAPTMPTPPAKYMTGGVIPGNDNEDRTLLLASSGERVLTQEQNALFERFVQSMENGGSSPVVNVQVYIDGDEINIEKKIIEIQKKDKWSGKWGM